MGTGLERTISIQQLLESGSLGTESEFRDRVGEIVLVGAIPRDGEGEDRSWSFVTRQGVADLTTDPEVFQRSQLWPLTKRGLLKTLLGNVLTIGRAESNDVWIDSPALSKVHARFRTKNDVWELADAGSKNGTAVNGKALKPNQFQAVSAGDRVNLAGIPCRIYTSEKLHRILRFMTPIAPPESPTTPSSHKTQS